MPLLRFRKCIVATASEFPDLSVEGQHGYSQDNDTEYIYNGTAWVPNPGGGGGTSGDFVEAVVSFGAGETDARVTVTGQSWVVAGSRLIASLHGSTTDHDVEDGLIEGILVTTGNIVASVGFDVLAHAPNGSWGQYKIHVTGV